MKQSLDFLIKVNQLKEMPRAGWFFMGIKNPESVAAHTFRASVAAWLMSQKKRLNTERLIKIALSHDFCDLYAGEKAPFFYYADLPQNEKKRKSALKKWVRLSKKEKEKRSQMKLKTKEKSLLKLIKKLSPSLKKEIYSCWLDYEKGISKEARFFKQIERIETLIQSLEYFGKDQKTGGTTWWERTEEMVEDPLLLDFLKIIQRKFYGKQKKPSISKMPQRYQKELNNILDFLLELGRLKNMPRLYWTIRGIKKPETVSDHIFTVAVMAWILADKKKHDLETLLKMALCHEISAVHTGDSTPYDKILPKDKKTKEKVLDKWPRLSKKEKSKIFIEDFREEKKAFKKLSSKLKPPFKKEIVKLWEEYRTRSTPEGHFLSQINVLAVLLQALIYKRKNKSFSATPIWEWAFEISDGPINFDLMEQMKKEFY
jgi:putative hydrolase of HD superfamily